MYRSVKMLNDAGQTFDVFLVDLETGNTAKDVFTVPGVYDSLTQANQGVPSLKLRKLQGTMGTYRTECFVLTIEPDVATEDVTSNVVKFLTMPETAATTMLRAMPEEDRDTIGDALEVIHFYEGVKMGDKLCIPVDAFVDLPAQVAEEMTSRRHAYTLKSTDNQEIFPTACDTEYGVLLPSLEDIHSGGDGLVSTLDILRVIAPYRREERPGVYNYNGIYHTPYYKVNPKYNGAVPSYLQWLPGYSVNDMLDLAPNERHMANNLQTLMCSDLSRYVAEMTSGIFFDSPLGSLLAKFVSRKDDEVLQQLFEDIKERSTADAACNISFTEVEELRSTGWYQADVIRTIKKNLVFSNDFLQKLIEDRPVDRRTIECGNLPFILELSDDQEQKFTELMIQKGYISSSMQRFMIDLCKKAYRVNWGHTGASMAIPGLAAQSQIEDVNKALAAYLGDRAAGQLPAPDKYPALFIRSATNSDENGEGGDEEDDDAPSLGMDYYVTVDTAQKIAAGVLSHDYFSTKPTAAQTTEASIVEYWRNINGENNLDNFISAALLRTADTGILIECVVKLLRWGERKPKLLVLQNHPEIRHVFDMGTGLRVDNTAIVDENELVKFNGCDFSLQGYLVSDSNPTLQTDQIVGFILAKDYGSVKKLYLASWVDLGEMVSKGEIKIGDFVAVTKVDLSPENRQSIEQFSRQEHDFYVSDSNIEQGLKLKVQPRDLNTLALLTTPAIMNSREYLKSLKGDVIITVKDRQYDILRRYVNTVNAFYVQHGGAINAAQNTMELSTFAESFYKMYQNQADEKQDANTAHASATMKALNIEGLNSGPSVNWDTTELTGKFYIISDVEMQSTLPPIEFSNSSVKATAAKVRNRVVLLLLQKDGKFIFCRKDIQPNEVMIINAPDGKGGTKQALGHKTYKTFASLIDNLMKGVEGSINKQPAVLHESLRDFL